jgi:hypothetical protein
MQIVRAMLLVRATLRRAKPIPEGRVVALRRASGAEPVGRLMLFGRLAGLQAAGLQAGPEVAAALPFDVSLVNSRIAGMNGRDVMPGAVQSSSPEASPGQSARPEPCPLSITSLAKPEPLPPPKE